MLTLRIKAPTTGDPDPSVSYGPENSRYDGDTTGLYRTYQNDAKTRNNMLNARRSAEASLFRTLAEFAKALRLHTFGILTSYAYPIFIGALEAPTDKTKIRQIQTSDFGVENASPSKSRPYIRPSMLLSDELVFLQVSHNRGTFITSLYCWQAYYDLMHGGTASWATSTILSMG